jgi:hypothetical protein
MENELTALGSPVMAKVPAQFYTDSQALMQTPVMKKVAQDSLPSHRNSHR